MNRIISMSIFVIIILAVFGLLNYYVINRTLHFLGVQKSFWNYIAIVFTTLSFFASILLERSFPSSFSKWFYVCATAWIGVLFFTFCILLLTELVNLATRLPIPLTGRIIIAASLLISLISIINAQTIHIKEVNIPIKGLDKEMTFVQLSDIHLGTLHQKNFISDIVKKTNSLNPQAVFITGDLFDGSAPIDKDTISPINGFDSEVFFVTGNHEDYEGLNNVSKTLGDVKIRWLKDEQISFKNITILGVNYMDSSNEFKNKISKMKINSSKPVILLYHSPQSKVDFLARNNISIQLSGHTHNGQIFPFSVLVWLAHPYAVGLHSTKDNSAHIYISPGTGTWGPPMRLGSRNEITLIHLIPSA